MCGRYTFPDEESTGFIGRMLDSLRESGQDFSTGTLTPGMNCPVVVMTGSGRTVPRAMHWGYRLSDGKLVFNTRSETADEKPLFRDDIRARRCLIPASGYFEWEKRGDEKIRYELSPKDRTLFFMAGIFRLRDGAEEFSILTRQASDDISFIHDRMPVILPEGFGEKWLSPDQDPLSLIAGAETVMRFRAE